ncbi:MAG: methyltransferase domain-containing protein [Lysobacteraceae bacterium]|nr:MAG: methyltransferase domain-containing protein [Xanthomonadaceae bacterium]
MSDGFAYDVVDYPSHVHPQMHPSRLGAIARLHGIAAESPARCRLLEVGCGDGLQLLALAQAYPDARFIGIDLSSRAVERGDAMRIRLGLGNLQLVAADVTTWDPGAESFDYIVAHGFYSWVPQPVREGLLALCGRALAPCGIGYISYNALPGSHLRRMVWEMMRFHVRDVEEPSERVRKAREFLQWLGNDVFKRGSYGPAVRHEAERLLKDTHPSVLFHDDLASINNPFTLTDFAAHVGAHGLAFLAEADYHEMNPVLLGKEGQERFSAVRGNDRVANDQYLDFLKGRRFRQSLICRGSTARSELPDPGAVMGLHASGHLRIEPLLQATGEPAGERAGVVRFANPDGAALSTNHPVVKAALERIGDMFPQHLAVTELLAQARVASMSELPPAEDAEALSVALMRAFELGLLSLLLDPPSFASSPGDRPVASPLARLQVEDGAETIANLRTSMVSLDSRPAIELLQLLDGTRDREAILRDLAIRMSGHALPAGQAGGSESHDAAWWASQLAPTLEEALQLSARMALLLEPR